VDARSAEKRSPKEGTYGGGGGNEGAKWEKKKKNYNPEGVSGKKGRSIRTKKGIFQGTKITEKPYEKGVRSTGQWKVTKRKKRNDFVKLRKS